ncbi:MAG: energy transducer TonB [Gammaproteobacteria bacterium]|nr:energy transducer TonB [Gammaproteobacteria bacterium]MYD79427.1 energy transducer TonB [Gammaproteobacteria bacterium]
MQKVFERYGVGIVVGSVVTVGLLYLMQAVISSDKNPLNEAPNVRPMDIVRLLDDIEPPKIDRNVKPPPPPEEFPPDIPEADLDLSSGEGWSTLDFEPQGPGKAEFGPGDYTSDGEYLPIVKVNPQYPRRALQRGIEGWVIVQFTVTETGSTEDPFVVDSDPPGIFDRAAINAALKFVYKPRVVDGKPIRVTGVKNRITFELEDEP